MPVWLELIPALSALLDRLIPDAAAREQAKMALVKAEHEQDLESFKLAISADQQQSDINRQEAASPSLFVSGWRPFIGWVCGAAFAYHFILQPLLAFALANSGHSAILPAFDMQELSTILMGMLGLGSLRTLEKLKNAD